jgi:hypothetical protein
MWDWKSRLSSGIRVVDAHAATDRFHASVPIFGGYATAATALKASLDQRRPAARLTLFAPAR